MTKTNTIHKNGPEILGIWEFGGIRVATVRSGKHFTYPVLDGKKRLVFYSSKEAWNYVFERAKTHKGKLIYSGCSY